MDKAQILAAMRHISQTPRVEPDWSEVDVALRDIPVDVLEQLADACDWHVAHFGELGKLVRSELGSRRTLLG